MIIISPTQSDVQAALRSFLLAVMPPNTDVVVAQQNRVPEPKCPNFVIITPTRFKRLATNIDESGDVSFLGSISGTVLSVEAMDMGTIAVGATLFGPGVSQNTTIVAPITGTGGVGTYSVSPAQNVPSGTMAAGVQSIQQNVELTAQLDFHSALTTTAGDMAQVFSTLFRDQYASTQFEGQSPNYGVSPLYCEDPAQRPFLNEAQQVEWRWVVDAYLQVDQVVTVPLQYADVLKVVAKSVDVIFPT